MRLSDLPADGVWIIRATGIESMMSGAYKAGFYPDGKIVVVYTDGTRETAIFERAESEKIANKENWFSIVSEVQSKRSQ